MTTQKQPKPTKIELRQQRQEAKKDRQIFNDLIRRLKAKGIEYSN
jgi:hypothetical protein